MTRIFVENQELDITSDISAQLNFAVDDLVNLDSKSSSFSKTIVIPGSVRNNLIFGNIFEFTNSNFPTDENPNVYYNYNASKSAQARIEINGLPAMKGVMRMMSIIIDRGVVEYEIVLFSELGGFISALGNKKLQDLDFSAYDVEWRVIPITDSWDNYNAGSGVVFPLIDYGNVSLNRHDYYFRAFRPAMFVKEYVDKIIDNSGYTYESDFLNTNFFKRLIIPNNDKDLLNKDLVNYVIGDLYPFTEDTGFLPTTRIIDIPFPSYTISGQFAFNSPNEFEYIDSQIRNVAITFNLVAYYEQEFEKPIGSNYTFSASYSKLQCLKNGVSIADVDLPIAAHVGDTGNLFQGNIDKIIKVNVELNQYDKIKFRVISSTRSSSFIYTSNWDTRILLNDRDSLITAHVNIVNDPAESVPYSYTDTLKINDTIPKNIFQKDFFTSLMKMFNLMIVESKLKDKHLIIIPNVDFYYISNAIDWSDKINRNKPIKIKPMSEINARYYDFNYKGDNDYYNELYKKRWNQGYGDRQYDNGMDFATQNKKVEIIFSSSVLVGYPDEDKIVPVICKIDQKGSAEEKEESIAHNLRIMQCKKMEGVSAYDIYENITDPGASVLGSPTNYLYAGHFNDPDDVTSDLNFGSTKELFYALTTGALQNNIWNAFYSTYMAEITDKDARLVSGEIYLTETEIFNLDFRKLIFFDGALYKLYKLIDWVAGDVCKVELLRVINTTYESIFLQRCTINSSSNPDPYSGNTDNYYFQLSKIWSDDAMYPFTFTIMALIINEVDYGTSQTFTINDITDVHVATGLDGRVYYTDVVDWVNSLIPSESKLKFYDDFNTKEHPNDLTFSIVIQMENYGGLYLGLYRYNNTGFYVATTIPAEPNDYALIGDSTYKNCILIQND